MARPMLAHDFDKLTHRDLANEAVLDEIRAALRDRDAAIRRAEKAEARLRDWEALAVAADPQATDTPSIEARAAAILRVVEAVEACEIHDHKIVGAIGTEDRIKWEGEELRLQRTLYETVRQLRALRG